MLTPELTDQLTDLVEAGIQEAIVGREAMMKQHYDKLIQAHEAGYRDSDIWRRAQLDRDQLWLKKIAQRQAGVNRHGLRWTLLQELASAMGYGHD